MTAFSSRGRQYVWKVLPMGLSVSPGIFQSVMMEIFGEYINKGVLVYIDDILIYSKSEMEHFRLLKIAFEKLKEAGI